MWSTSPGRMAGTPSIRPTGLIQGMTFFATHHGSRYTSKTNFQTQMKRTSPFGPVTFYMHIVLMIKWDQDCWPHGT